MFSKHSGNPPEKWKTINTLLGTNSQDNPDKIVILNETGNELTTGLFKVAWQLNEDFANTDQRLTDGKTDITQQIKAMTGSPSP